MKGLEGSKLGRYELRCRIAQGGMAEVYLGYDSKVRRWVAVKVLYGSSESFVKRFEREALAVGALSHEHILTLYDFGEQRPWYYLVMPYVEGGTLRDHLLKRERFTLEEAGSFLDQIASALQYAHDHGVIHRDVKPSNVLLRPDGHAYLVDFGLAKAKIDAKSQTHSGAMVGTPEYMAPEQSNGLNDYRSDIYSLGIILYQMLTGRVPFMAESPVAVSLKHMQTPPIPPTQFNSEIPSCIEAVMLRALAKNPEERYQEARTFSEAYWKELQQERVYKIVEEIAPGSSTEKEPLRSLEAKGQTTALTLAEPLLDIPLTRPQLFPLGYETSFIPKVSGRRNRRRHMHPLFISLLCLTLLVSTVALKVLWQTSNSHPENISTQSATTTASKQQTTATALTQAHAQATLAAEARAQATAGITTSIGIGNILYANEMTTNSGGWINDGVQCYFSPQGYHVYTASSHTVAWCYSNQRQFSDTIITTQAQLLYGAFYGILFRLNPANKTFYALEINSHSEYRFQRARGNDPSRWLTLIDWTTAHAIPNGYGKLMTCLLIAAGPRFSFYINQQLLVSTFTDSAYTSGSLGFLVGEDTTDGTEAIFRHVTMFEK